MMKINLLAYSADPDLLTMLSSLNEKREEFFVEQVGVIEELYENIDRQTFDAVLIDAAGDEIPLDLLTGDLIEQHPGTRILLLPPDNDSNSPELKDAIVHRLLVRPVTSDDLAKALDELFPASPAQTGEPAAEERDPPAVFKTDENHEPSLIEIIDAAEFDEPISRAETVESESVVESEPDSAEIVDSRQDISAEKVTNTIPPEVRALRLSYCCVLIPRYPQQYLARDLADRAAAILPQVHLSRGWRVTGISVRPQYMQWFITLPVDTSPVDAMQEIRHRTSLHFYTHFPELTPGRQDGDFWAPGYLMMSGTQPVSPVIIREFIERTRSRQQHGD